ncbi:DEKNAAC104059 [Brettanomyces naardenensis]|uniref:DNA-directed DNA polymerase n=1 Tax=Brettanomyces naardenensis TaxID=13370 RepID=A0A448YQH9_BRENA|nr:DEKNAAC104059 [Brettanomyces naardenensis]
MPHYPSFLDHIGLAGQYRPLMGQFHVPFVVPSPFLNRSLSLSAPHIPISYGQQHVSLLFHNSSDRVNCSLLRVSTLPFHSHRFLGSSTGLMTTHFRSNSTSTFIPSQSLHSLSPRINPVGIQRISDPLFHQIFPSKPVEPRKSQTQSRLIKLSHKYLADNELLGKECSINDPISFQLPKLQGKDLAEHFQRLGAQSCGKYLQLVEELLRLGNSPPKAPNDHWIFQPGWTRYAPGKAPERVDYPLEDQLVFDVEVMYKLSHYPILATCMSPKAWYGWCSPYLTGDDDKINGHLIPLDVINKEKVIVGHNVSYDRARVREEYHLEGTKAFYLDTMSLHIAVSGMCSRQRGTWMKYKKKQEEEKALDTSLEHIRETIKDADLKRMLDNPELDDNDDPSLADDPWMKMSSLNSLKHVASLHCGIKMNKEVRDEFASLDIEEIRRDFQKLMNYCSDDVDATYRVFAKVFPEFRRIIPHDVSFAALRHVNQSFLPTTREWNEYIRRCEEQYQQGFKKIEEKLKDLCREAVSLRDRTDQPWESDPWLSQLDWTIQPVRMTKAGKPYKNQKLPGYPEWFKKLVVKKELNLTTKTRIAPLLLRLSWEGKPVFWTDSKGWCFEVEKGREEEFKKKNYLQIEDEWIIENEPKMRDELEELLITRTLFKVPHEAGPNMRTTSLMSKPFLRYFEQGILSSEFQVAKDALQLAVSNSYWVSSRERIMNQFVIFEDEGINLGTSDASATVASTSAKQVGNLSSGNKVAVGAIIPQVISMGTITRRAVEKTWLTASNAKESRLGSELKAMVKAPPGYCFVGADVDSEELWIASLMGDSVFKIHGGTALGWMTLEGNKSLGTDLHSKTAKILGISRSNAKIFNYGRIYGAGAEFATTLLKKFNPELSVDEAVATARKLYSSTKGKSSRIKGQRVWYGGSESVVFNRLEKIAQQDDPKTPVLGAGITAALQRKNLKSNTLLPSRLNWAIQSSGVDYLHLLLVSVEYLSKVYKIPARLCLTVHDEIRYLTKWEDRYKLGMILQIANLWTRAMFCHQVGIDDVPQGCAFFSAVDFDHVIRKEVNMDCITPSNETAIDHGESLDIYELLAKREVQELLSSVKDPDLSDIPVKKTIKPVEELDKNMDSGTRSLYIAMQIATSEKEFKKYKNKYLRNLDVERSESFFRKLRGEGETGSKVVQSEVDEDWKEMESVDFGGFGIGLEEMRELTSLRARATNLRAISSK